jgi:putative transposon-encoded protein
MKVEIDGVEEVIEKEVEGYKTSTRISIPSRYKGRKVKILVMEEKG